MRGRADLRERVRRLPGMHELLPALIELPPVYLVGGPVRNVLAVDARLAGIDLAVEGDARAVAREIAARLNGRIREYESFGTATIWAGRRRVRRAPTRRETYDEPGALPKVEPAPLAETEKASKSSRDSQKSMIPQPPSIGPDA